MIIDRKEELLTLNAYLHLRMAYIAVVTAYECHVRRNAMAVNRLLLVFRDAGEGECTLRSPAAGQQFAMRAGHLYFIPCSLEVDLDITPAISFISLHFNLDLLYGLDVFRNTPRCETAADPALIAEVREALSRGSQLATLCRLNALVFGLCSSWLPVSAADLNESLVAWRQYEDVLDFVRSAGDATTTVEALADLKGMRNDVFSRRFTRDLGITPKEFITRTLMRKASRMLLNPDVSVRSVARELRFSSEYYFSRFFKKHSGQPPRLYRRSAGVHH